MSDQSHNSFQQAPSLPAVISVNLGDEPPPRVIDLGDMLLSAGPRVISLPLADTLPGTISIPITNPAVRVRSFVFQEPTEMPASARSRFASVA